MEATLSSAIIESYVSSLDDGAERDRFRSVVKKLSDASQADGLTEFLGSFSESVADLFAASAVAVWFRNPTSPGVSRRVDVGWNNFELDKSTAKAHQQLIEFVIGHADVVAVHPFSAPIAKAGVSNPTDSFLLLAPARCENEAIAVLEIALGPKPLRRPHESLVVSYLPWLRWLSGLLETGMRRCFEAEQPLFLALSRLQHAAAEVEAIQARIRLTIQASLQDLAGKKFGSLAANQRVAKQVHSLLDSKGLRVKCPECGAPAILRCQNSGNSKTGAFVYDHYLENGRTFHGGPSTFPTLELVAKPPRRQSS